MAGVGMVGIRGAVLAATTVDEFLGRPDEAAADRLRQIGEAIGMAGVLLAGGLLVFLTVVHRGPRPEIRRLVAVVSAGGAAAGVGGVIELIGTARRFDTSLSDVLTLDAGSAAMLRALAGLLVALGLFDHSMAVATRPASEAGDTDDPGDDDESVADRRWVPSSASSFGIGGALLGVVSFAFDGHTVSKGPRLLHAAANTVHVAAAAIWLGGLLGLAIVGAMRHRDGHAPPLGSVVIRFSSLATTAVVAVAVAGVGISLMIVDEPSDYVDTVWGKRLIIKTVAVASAAAVGGYNHWVLTPALRLRPADPDLAQRARTTVVVELIVLTFVVVATAALVAAPIS